MGAKTMRKTGAPSGTKKWRTTGRRKHLYHVSPPDQHEVKGSKFPIVVVVTNKTNIRKRSHATATSIITILHYILIFLVLCDVCLSTVESRM